MLLKIVNFPTEHFSNLEPYNSSNTEFSKAQKRRLLGSEIVKKVRSGC